MSFFRGSTERARVLVVDDSRVIRKAIGKVLGSEFELTEAEDGEAGWDTLTRDNRTEVVISDIQMPRLDGYGMICRIRAAEDPRLRDIPIIVITGAEDEITKERAYACGANDFILKPIDSAQLLNCVQNHTTANHGSAGAQPSQAMLRHAAAVEEAVMEEPGVDAALEILQGPRPGTIEPYALDLALKVIPLLEFCEKEFDLELSEELRTIKNTLSRIR